MCVLVISFLTGLAFAETDYNPDKFKHYSLYHDKTNRSYSVYSPENPERKSLPAVVLLHGTTSSPHNVLEATQLYKKADKEKFYIILPQSLGIAFNEGSGRGTKIVKNVNDTDFIEQSIQDALKHYSINLKKIYLTGFSSGASMVLRMVAESSFPFAAIAAYQDALWVNVKSLPLQRPLLLIFGDKDPRNPVDGGTIDYRAKSGIILDKPAQMVTAQNIASLMGCSTEYSSQNINHVLTSYFFKKCLKPFRYDLIKNLGHQWAGGKPNPNPEYGPYHDKVNINDLIWSFFEDVSKE